MVDDSEDLSSQEGLFTAILYGNGFPCQHILQVISYLL